MNIMNHQPQSSTGHTQFLFLVVGVSLLALAGYTGYTVYPRFDLPAGSGAVLLVLAAMAGIASFFSPYSFPLLLTLLTRTTNGDGDLGRSLLKNLSCVRCCHANQRTL